MILKKYDYKMHMYKNFKVPNDRDVRLSVYDLKEVINCANCGNEVVAGNTYSSLTIHNKIGLGYLICEECYEKELKKRLKYKEE